MFELILRRLGTALPVLLAVITLTFLMVHSAPGGPFDAEKAVTPEVLAKLNAKYNLDAPLWEQYSDYLLGVVQGDFGPSFRYPSRSVTELIMTGLPITFELAVYAIIFALLLGVSAGILGALKPNTVYDYVPMTTAMLGICVPSIILGPSLILTFGIWLEWLPVGGWGDIPGDKILPTVTLGTAYAAYCARLTRGGMLEVLNQDFIRTARAKGLSEFRVIIVHALRGGLTPVIAFLGPAMAGLLAGSFVVETIFGIPGLGRFYVEAAFNRDYTMILGSSIFFSCLIISFNLLSDVIAASINPKLRQ